MMMNYMNMEKEVVEQCDCDGMVEHTTIAMCRYIFFDI